ncbi:XRE family transcriptional regulator [Aliishimia ponticola]|uniref:XRE family transcriptional regulator n=2 Tax=Aliishimia ponticola TaxID=2499833 RepID=A0A4S4NHQ0_9RHOB|nr:XRE family transcriptional regulator [Aliishimia ponticola]
MFGANLRAMARDYPSISELSRQLDINRTQFNRYLAGESFPRPDVLARICDFFDVDARVLLEPVSNLTMSQSVLEGPELREYFGTGAHPNEAQFPSGFYRFTRRSFFAPESYVIGLVRVWRNSQEQCFVRGFEAREAIRQQDLPMTPEYREFRGHILRLEAGIGFVIARRQAQSASYNFLAPVPSFENNFFAGYVSRTVPESVDSERIVRMVYEHLGTTFRRALEAGRGTGLVTEEQIPNFTRRLLKPQTPFR